jgi:DNA topoisomerase VI subunit B
VSYGNMKKKNIFERTAFVTDRALEFFTDQELTTQIGYRKELWPLVLVKELIDNALDASDDVPPEIVITLDKNAVTVQDNGPGLKTEIIEKSLDYSIRISDKKGYIGPTRGQLGNALKCVWAAPFVATRQSVIEASACGLDHRIEVNLDRLAQKPRIQLSHKNGPVKKALRSRSTGAR